MAREVKVKVTVSRLANQRLLKEYKEAVAEHRRLGNYLKTADSILSKAERELLQDFVQIAKRKSDRLRRVIRERSPGHAA
jgi:hypothetical protein